MRNVSACSYTSGSYIPNTPARLKGKSVAEQDPCTRAGIGWSTRSPGFDPQPETPLTIWGTACMPNCAATNHARPRRSLRFLSSKVHIHSTTHNLWINELSTFAHPGFFFCFIDAHRLVCRAGRKQATPQNRLSLATRNRDRTPMAPAARILVLPLETAKPLLSQTSIAIQQWLRLSSHGPNTGSHEDCATEGEEKRCSDGVREGS